MSEKPEKRVKFWRKRIVVLGTGALLVLAAGLGLLFWFARPLFAGPALTALTVTGRLQHVDPNTVRTAVLPAIGTGFFTTRVDAVSGAVQQIPWVAEADVRREWPHTLHVDILEEVPVARWNGDGLMDARGRVFAQDPQKAYVALPALSGLEGGEQDLLAQYNTLASLVAPRGLSIVALTVDARGAATVLLNDGIEVRLGREDAEARLARFSAIALPALSAKLATVAYVDMRYTNGFAVGWKTPGERTRQGA
ncbi:MAG: cell division protein FtsQ/DivIB [Bacillota bacterium]